MKSLNKWVICYFHCLKSIRNDDLFKECIHRVVFFIWSIYHKKVFFFQLVAFKKYAIMKCLLFQLVVMNNYRKQPQRGVPWNQLKSETLCLFETLYLLNALKEPVQIVQVGIKPRGERGEGGSSKVWGHHDWSVVYCDIEIYSDDFVFIADIIWWAWESIWGQWQVLRRVLLPLLLQVRPASFWFGIV